MARGNRKKDNKLKNMLENSTSKKSSHFSHSTDKASKEKTLTNENCEKTLFTQINKFRCQSVPYLVKSSSLNLVLLTSNCLSYRRNAADLFGHANK